MLIVVETGKVETPSLGDKCSESHAADLSHYTEVTGAGRACHSPSHCLTSDWFMLFGDGRRGPFYALGPASSISSTAFMK